MIAGIWKRFRTHEARVTERMSRLAEVETFRALMFAGIAEGKTIQISAQNGVYLLNAEQVSRVRQLNA